MSLSSSDAARLVIDLPSLKMDLLRLVGTSLINEPNFFSKSPSPVKTRLNQLMLQIAPFDSEFLLKVALYVRDDLNIRSTANYILALSSTLPSSAAFLKLYLPAIVRLPSDWLDIPALYLCLESRALQGRSFPTSLRKAMAPKFYEFDTYQLAKYNREKTIKRKMKKLKIQRENGSENGNSDDEAEAENDPASSRAASASARGRGRGRGGAISRGRGRGGAAAAQTRPVRKMNDRPHFTMKSVIRQLHISHPVYAVMCVLGKKYPATLEDFYRLGLPGTFDADRANTRMKLPVPETWETFLSARGNHSATWEELMDHNKLPFMAMLRNLRNLLIVGISPRHHKWIISRLKNENQVVNSRQFPFAFFSAFEALDLKSLQEEVTNKNESAKKKLASQHMAKKKMKKAGIVPAPAKPSAKPANVPKVDAAAAKGKGREKQPLKELTTRRIGSYSAPTEKLLAEYREALDTSIKIATVHNVPPITGRTIVVCQVTENMTNPCKSAKGLGSKRTILEVSILLGLMCKYVCEDCGFYLFCEPSESYPLGYMEIQLESQGSILHNMKAVIEAAKGLTPASDIPSDFLETFIIKKTKIDNLMLMTHGISSKLSLLDLLPRYRSEVNSGMLFVNVDLSGAKSMSDRITPDNPNDVYLAGFSEQILRFIAERGNKGQLDYVENIRDVKGVDDPKRAKRLEDIKAKGKALLSRPLIAPFQSTTNEKKRPIQSTKALPNISHSKKQIRLLKTSSEWKTVRVFISSTFIDMHGERDILINEVFPLLREQMKERRIIINEVDLRWGLTSHDAMLQGEINLCLSEIDKCRPFFIGIIGSRYGYVPSSYTSAIQQFPFLQKIPAGKSITELEMIYGALQSPVPSKAFFYIRDPAIAQKPSYISSVAKESASNQKALEALRSTIRKQFGSRLFDGYPCDWVGPKQGKPGMATNLAEFASKVRKDLLSELNRMFPKAEVADTSSLIYEDGMHYNIIDTLSNQFCGRSVLVQKVCRIAQGLDADLKFGILTLVGSPGSGKSALISAITLQLMSKPGSMAIIPHIVGATQQSRLLPMILARINDHVCRELEMVTKTGLDNQELRREFRSNLELLAGRKRVCLILDGLQDLSDFDHAHAMDWLPYNLANVSIIATTSFVNPAYDNIKKMVEMKKAMFDEIVIPDMDREDKKSVLRNYLGKFGKKLDESSYNNQLEMVLRKKESSQPLYLDFIAEEVRTYGIFQKLNDFIQQLPENLLGIIETSLRRLEVNMGYDVIKVCMSVLACGRGYVTDVQLRTILNDSCTGLNNMTWFKLLSSIETFVRTSASSGQGTVLEIRNESIAKAIEMRYLGSESTLQSIHRQLASNYWKLVDPDSSDIFAWRQGAHLDVSKLYDIRIAHQEIAVHYIGAASIPDIRKTLLNLRFLENKFVLNQGGQILQDFKKLFDSTVFKRSKDTAFKDASHAFFNFIWANMSIFTKTPQYMAQQALNYMQGSPLDAAAQEYMATRYRSLLPPILFRRLNIPSSSGPCKTTLSELSSEPTKVAFSPTSEAIGCGFFDGTVALFNNQGVMKGTAKLSGHDVTALVFSPDGEQIIAGYSDGQICAWTASHMTPIKSSFPAHQRDVSGISFSSTGKLMLSCGWDCKVKVYTASTFSVTQTLSGHTKPINAAAFSPSGTYIISAGWDGVRLWIAETGGQVMDAFAVGQTSVRSVCISPDDKRVAFATFSGTISIWDLHHKAQVANIQGHHASINSLQFTPSGHQLLSAAEDGMVKIWNSSVGREIIRRNSAAEWVNVLAADPSGNYVACGHSDSSISIWDLATNTLLHTLKEHSYAVRCLAYSSGGILVSGSDDCGVIIWNKDPAQGPKHVLEGHTGAVNHVAVSANGLYVASASSDQTIRVWSLKSGTFLYELRGHFSFVYCCDFHPTEQKLVSVGRDCQMIVWDLKSKTVQSSVVASSDWVTRCCYSPEGTEILTTGWDFNIHIWDVRNLTVPRNSWKGHTNAVTCALFSEKGDRILSCSFDGTIRLWDRANGIEMTCMKGHRKGVNTCGFAKGDSFVMSGSDDGCLVLWDVVSSSELRTLTGHSEGISSASLANREGQLVSASKDGTVRIWSDQESMAAEADMISKQPAFTLTDATSSVALSPCGRYAAYASIRDELWLSVQPFQSSAMCRNIRLISPIKEIRTVFFVAGGATLVVGGSDTKLYMWDIPSVIEHEHFNGKVVQIDELDQQIASALHHPAKSSWSSVASDERDKNCIHNKLISCSAVSPINSNLAATGSWDGSVCLLDFTGVQESGRACLIRRCAFQPNDWVTHLVITSDGSRLWGATCQSGIFLIDLADTGASIGGNHGVPTSDRSFVIPPGKIPTALGAVSSDDFMCALSDGSVLTNSFITEPGYYKDTPRAIVSLPGGFDRRGVGYLYVASGKAVSVIDPAPRVVDPKALAVGSDLESISWAPVAAFFAEAVITAAAADARAQCVFGDALGNVYVVRADELH